MSGTVRSTLVSIVLAVGVAAGFTIGTISSSLAQQGVTNCRGLKGDAAEDCRADLNEKKARALEEMVKQRDGDGNRTRGKGKNYRKCRDKANSYSVNSADDTSMADCRISGQSAKRPISVNVQATSIAVGDAVRVSGLLLAPPQPRACYVLAHGAGAGMNHPFMAAVAAGLAERGIATLRYQFPYMEQGGKRPDPPKLAHAAVRAAVAEAARLVPRLPLVRRRQVVRRPHDLAGAGARTAARRARPRLPRLSAASRRQAVARARQASVRRAISRCCSCRARATRSPHLDELEPLCAAARRARDAQAASPTPIIPSTCRRAAAARMQRSAPRCSTRCAAWIDGVIADNS